MDVTAQLLSAFEDYEKPLWTDEITLQRNELLHPAGEIHTNIYFVTEGSLRIFHETGSDLNTIRFGYKGSMFVSLDSLLTNAPSLYAVQALKKATLKVMVKEDFLEFVESDTVHLRLWNSILSYTVYGQLEREIDLLTTSPQERYERVLKRSPRLFQEVPHRYIASYLRMAPETLSRLMKS